jgi:hypothetical protein
VDVARHRIGWVAGSDLFLEPKSSYRVAQQMPGLYRVLWMVLLLVAPAGAQRTR